MKLKVEITTYGWEVKAFHSPEAEESHRKYTNMYFSVQQVAEILAAKNLASRGHWVDDGIRQYLVGSFYLTSIYVSEWYAREGVLPADQVGFTMLMDTRAFFTVLTKLRAKFPPPEQYQFPRRSFDMDTNHFNRRQYAVKPLSFVEIVRHPNAREIAPTLARFMRSIKPRQKERMKADLSRMLPNALFFGTRDADELYFDGRRRGLGFNGAMILRDDEYSTHT